MPRLRPSGVACPEPAEGLGMNGEDSSPTVLPRATSRERPAFVMRAPPRQEHAPACLEHAPAKLADAPASLEHARSSSERARSSQEHAPSIEARAPARLVHACSCLEQAPARQEHAPAKQEHAPANEEHAPANEEHAPAKLADAPACLEQAPARLEHAPAARERRPALATCPCASNFVAASRGYGRPTPSQHESGCRPRAPPGQPGFRPKTSSTTRAIPPPASPVSSRTAEAARFTSSGACPMA